MTGLPAQRIALAAQRKPEPDWTARLALAGAAGFGVLLLAFGLILYRSWPQMSGVDRALASLSERTDRVASGQELLSRDIATLRSDLRSDRTDRAQSSGDTAALRTRVGDLSSSVTELKAQADRLEAREAAAAHAGGPAPVPAAPQQDPAIAELRARLDALQQRLDQLAASRSAGTAAIVASAPPPVAAPTALSSKPATFSVDELDREVRDMQRVIRQRQTAAAVRGLSAATIKPTVTSTMGDPLAPITSRTPPRVAPVRAELGGVGQPEFFAPAEASVSRFPLATGQSAATGRAVASAVEPRVTRVGVNSAMGAVGPLGLPFDAIGNLFAAIGEGLDHLFTGRAYLPRPAPAEGPAQARR